MDALKDMVLDLISRPAEEEWFEFKLNWYEPHELGEYLSALSNAAAYNGLGTGYLVWGVEDGTHDIAGSDFSWKRDIKGEPLEHYLSRQLSPDIAFRFEEIELYGKRLAILEVPAASKVPTAFGGVRYFRIGSSKVNLAKHPDREAELFRMLLYGPPTTENTEAATQELTFARLFTYYAGRGIALNQETFAKNLGLLTQDGRYNLLAQLVSDDNRMPIRVSIFSGKTKADPLYSVREFGNTCLLVALDRVLDYIDVLNIVQADERDRVVERRDVPFMEPEPVREAVVNAFVHNLWISGNAPMFTVFSDRLEILSRGSLPPGQTIEGFFRGESVPVNQRLSDMFLQLHISERSGRGVPKITERYGCGCYEFRENSISLVIPFNRIDAVAPADHQGPNGGMSDLNNTERRVLAALRDNPNLTHEQIATSIGKGVTTAQKAVRRLREGGYIERVGSNKSGWWRVL